MLMLAPIDDHNHYSNGRTDKLPRVASVKHLGNLLSSKINATFVIPDMAEVLRCKRGTLFDKIHQIKQQFGQLDPFLVVKLLSVYVSKQQ